MGETRGLPGCRDYFGVCTLGCFYMEKTSILKRKPCFWISQICGGALILFVSYFWSLSFGSVLCGILLVFVNMEFLFWLFPLRSVSVFFLLLKYSFLALIIYILSSYIDGLSFLVGLSIMFFYLLGLSLEAIKYDSL